MTVPKVRWVVLGVALLTLFLTLGLLVSGHPPGVDLAVRNWLSGQAGAPAGRVAAAVTDVFGPVLPIVFGAGLAVAAAVSWRLGVRARAGVLLRTAAVLVLCRLTSLVAKPLFLRDRPREYPDLSYPSGHVTSVATTGFAAVLLCVWLAPALVRRVAVLAAAATVFSAANRLVLGVHWLTDTIGAVLGVLGVGLLAAAVLGLLPTPSHRIPVTGRAA
ncbi:phosphatase PAP2 family protein [Amycolatopsis nigrescens]|uniref:phosphatase PAP2 family protein n=1 Tax=Amycolatopsis nigrescens TaxID=381445 RepID=UPI00038118B4|nr:phosphatase PAP2 family protein [Amycolatopsis nigrescens]